MKPKIAFVTPLYLPANLSGSGVVVRQLAEGLVQKGYDCSVITSNGLNTRWWYDPIFGKKIAKNFEIINGVKVHRLPSRQFPSFLALVFVRYLKFLLPPKLLHKLELFYCGPNLSGLEKLLKKEKFAILHTSPLPASLNKKVAETREKLSPRPKLVLMPCFHANLSDYQNPELEPLFKKVDLLHIFLSAEKQDIQKTFSIPNERFFIIPNFLNLSMMRKPGETEGEVKRFKKKFKLENQKVVLFAGNKLYLKGAITLLKTMVHLYKKDPSYVLITMGNNTPEWDKYKKQLDIDFLIDLGYVNDMQKEIVFAACDIFCLPSLAESFGLTYLEAWHKKKPVIGADIPTVRELIYNANGGLLVEFGNEKDLKEAIEKLALNPSFSKKLGENGYKTLITKYSSHKVIPKFTSIL